MTVNVQIATNNLVLPIKQIGNYNGNLEICN